MESSITNIKVKQIRADSEKVDIDRFIDTFLKLFNDEQYLLFLSFTNNLLPEKFFRTGWSKLDNQELNIM